MNYEILIGGGGGVRAYNVLLKLSFLTLSQFPKSSWGGGGLQCFTKTFIHNFLPVLLNPNP